MDEHTQIDVLSLLRPSVLSQRTNPFTNPPTKTQGSSISTNIDSTCSLVFQKVPSNEISALNYNNIKGDQMSSNNLSPDHNPSKNYKRTSRSPSGSPKRRKSQTRGETGSIPPSVISLSGLSPKRRGASPSKLSQQNLAYVYDEFCKDL